MSCNLKALSPSAERVKSELVFGLAPGVWDAPSRRRSRRLSRYHLDCPNSYQFAEKSDGAASKLAADCDGLTGLVARYFLAMNTVFFTNFALGPRSALHHDVHCEERTRSPGCCRCAG